MEPHPHTPDTNPYSGQDEGNTGCAYQPRVYADRVVLAQNVEAQVLGNQIMWVDELTPEPRNNPVWCSYGPAPVPGFLIGMDGMIHEDHSWLNVSTMQAAIDTLLGS